MSKKYEVNVRFNEEGIEDKIKDAAKKDDKSVNKFCVRAVKDRVQKISRRIKDEY